MKISIWKLDSITRIGEKNLWSFIDDFLNVILAEATVTCVVDLADKWDGFSLGDCKDPDPLGISSNLLRRLPSPQNHRAESSCDGCLHRRSCHRHSLETPCSNLGFFGNNIMSGHNFFHVILVYGLSLDNSRSTRSILISSISIIFVLSNFQVIARETYSHNFTRLLESLLYKQNQNCF